MCECTGGLLMCFSCIPSSSHHICKQFCKLRRHIEVLGYLNKWRLLKVIGSNRCRSVNVIIWIVSSITFYELRVQLEQPTVHHKTKTISNKANQSLNGDLLRDLFRARPREGDGQKAISHGGLDVVRLKQECQSPTVLAFIK